VGDHVEFVIGGRAIPPGKTVRLELPMPSLYNDSEVNMPVQIIRGRKPGPTLFVSAAVHGDELNGIEIIRRLVNSKSLKVKSGTLLLVPMVNVYGVLNKSRYTPDRRDLNRSFPGSKKGALASRIAEKFLTEIVEKCDYGIDLHTGAVHRSNLPQIRADLSCKETLALAEAFNVPVMLNANLRDNSLRESAVNEGLKILLYEAGEALRMDELSIRAGLRGVLNVLSYLGVISRKYRPPKTKPFIANKSAWVRANGSGIVRNVKSLGDKVEKGDVLAEIGDVFGQDVVRINADRSGVVIGQQNIPLTLEGDAMFHIAFFSDDEKDVVENIEAMQENLLPEEPLIN